MRAADTNDEGGLPAATLDGAPPSFSAQTHAKRMRRVQSYQCGPPIAAVQEMSDLLDADLGRPALEVLTRLCDQGVRPASVSPSGQPDRRARHAGQSDGARGRRT